MLDHLFANNEEGRLTILISGVILAVMGYVIYLLINGLKYGKNEDIGDQGYIVDGIREKTNAVPAMMHFIEAGAIFFGLWYVFIGFPINSWNQIKQYNDRVASFNRTQKAIVDRNDGAKLNEIGSRLFKVKCAACHGTSGDGMKGQAANLQEFGTEKHILYVIKNGSKGLRKTQPFMPSTYYQTLGEKGTVDVAAYALTLSGKTPAQGDPKKGQQLFITCTACHGPQGKPLIPNFATNLTQYGSVDYIEEIIRKGKNGHIGRMPSFEEEGTMNDWQYKAVAHYVANEISGEKQNSLLEK